MAAEDNLAIVGTATTTVATDGRMVEPDPSVHAYGVEGLQRCREATDCLRLVLHELAVQKTQAAGRLAVQQWQRDALDARAY